MDAKSKNRAGDSTRIGQLLLAQGVIDRDELQAGLKEQAEKGGRLVNILIAQGALDTQEFVSFLAEPEKTTTVNLAHIDIDPDVIALVPRTFALANSVVPVDRLGRVLTVAATQPLDEDTVEAIEEHTDLRVKVLIASAEDVNASLERYYEEGGAEGRAKGGAKSAVGDHLGSALKLTTAVAMLGQIESLPGLPGTVQRVREMVHEQDSSASEVGDVVSRDPSIAAKILRVANSAAYGFPHRVDSIQLAVTLLGLKEAYSVVLSTAVVNLFDRSRNFDYMTFWFESMVCATLASALSKAFHSGDQNGVFSAGLLHDLGRVALAEVAPKHYGRVDGHLVGRDLVDAEERLLGLTHTEAGYQLALHWDLPKELAETIRFHHTPEYADDETKTLVSLVNIADVVSRAHRPDSATREVQFEECRESLDFLDAGEEDVMDVFTSLPKPDPSESLWSPN